MKDRVKSSYFTKLDAFRVNRHQVIELETWFKIHTSDISIVETAFPKTIQCILNLNFLSIVTTINLCHSPTIRHLYSDKVYHLVSVYPKSIKLGHLQWCQFINWLKFETRSCSLHNLGMAYWYQEYKHLDS